MTASQLPIEAVDVDVVIVGMGPTGAVLAALLGQAGHTVAVIDRLPSLFPLPRAIGLDAEVMRVAQQLGIAEELQQHVIPYVPSEYRGADGQVIKRLDSPPQPHTLGWHAMFSFDQPAFEKIVRAQIAKLPSVTVQLDSVAESVGQNEEFAWADVRSADSLDVRRYRGHYLVACDGGSSEVRRSLGISMTDLEFHDSFLVVDAIIEDHALKKLPTTNVQYCVPERPATYVVLPGNHRRWEISLLPGELPIGAVTEEKVWPYLKDWIQPSDARLWRSAAYMFHALVAEEWRDRRILLAGDAAHMTPPFMAQGLAQGVRDAHNVSWKLGEALRGRRTAEQLLDSYMIERRPHVVTTTEHTIDLGRIICERDKEKAQARDLEFVVESGGEVPVTIRSSLLPDLVSGLIADSPGAGSRFPQPFVEAEGAQVRLDELTGTGFYIVVDQAIGETELQQLQSAADPLHASVVRILAPGAEATYESSYVEQDNLLGSWFEERGAAIAVIRPDHYVYGTAKDTAEALFLVEGLVQAITESKL